MLKKVMMRIVFVLFSGVFLGVFLTGVIFHASVGFLQEPSTACLQHSSSKEVPKPSGFEAELAVKIPFKETPYFIQKRYPVPKIPVYVVNVQRGCVLGGAICNTLKKNLWMVYDPHVRDIVASVLLPCKFNNEPCKAIDIGANFGMHTLSMLMLNTKVTSIEPQPDLCASLMMSATRLGMSDSARIRCGLVASADDVASGEKLRKKVPFDPAGAYHYDGQVEKPFTYEAHGLSSEGVPLVPLADLLPARGSELRLMKIDTDSIDCDIVNQVFDRIGKGELRVKNIIFESNGCSQIPQVLHRAQKMGFNVYRIDMGNLQFDELGSRPKSKGNVHVPTVVDELFELRFVRYLWRFHDKLKLTQWDETVGNQQWQYWLSNESVRSNPLKL